MYRNLLTRGTSNSKQKSIINMIILYYSSSDWSRKLYDMAKKRHVSEGLTYVIEYLTSLVSRIFHSSVMKRSEMSTCRKQCFYLKYPKKVSLKSENSAIVI